MKFLRVLSRLAILLIAVAAMIGWTVMHYGMHPALPEGVTMQIGTPGYEHWMYEQRHQPSASNVGYFTDFLAYVLSLAILTLAGRTLFRLRLNPPPRNAEKPILLDLRAARPRTPVIEAASLNRTP